MGLQNSLRGKRNRISNNYIDCPCCGKAFNSFKFLKTEDGQFIKDSNEQPIKTCPLCGYRFKKTK